MTPEEENKLQGRLGEAADIREQIKYCRAAIQHISNGIFGLNANTYHVEYEIIGAALSLVQDDVLKLLKNHITELEEKYKKL